MTHFSCSYSMCGTFPPLPTFSTSLLILFTQYLKAASSAKDTLPPWLPDMLNMLAVTCCELANPWSVASSATSLTLPPFPGFLGFVDLQTVRKCPIRSHFPHFSLHAGQDFSLCQLCPSYVLVCHSNHI
jgi:hypothetical protein